MDKSKMVDEHGYYEEEYFEYLDELRESGVVNMYGAGPYLTDEFNIPPNHAIKVLRRWMDTFSERHANED